MVQFLKLILNLILFNLLNFEPMDLQKFVHFMIFQLKEQLLIFKLELVLLVQLLFIQMELKELVQNQPYNLQMPLRLPFHQLILLILILMVYLQFLLDIKFMQHNHHLTFQNQRQPYLFQYYIRHHLEKLYLQF